MIHPWKTLEIWERLWEETFTKNGTLYGMAEDYATFNGPVKLIVTSLVHTLR